METLLILGGIIFVFWLIGQMGGGSSNSRTNGSSAPPIRKEPERPKDVYRPKQSPSAGSRIKFNEVAGNRNDGPIDLVGLHDAFTGEALNKALGLYQCTSCKVYYHTESYQVLRQENSSQCVACGSSSIVSITAGQQGVGGGRDYNPEVITLANFRSHFNRVVTFEGAVRSVKVSRRGTDYAVMFENAVWAKGLKLVFFKGSVGAVGGPSFIKGLAGSTVKVRGLLVNHPSFGPQIIITQRNMILEVRR